MVALYTDCPRDPATRLSMLRLSRAWARRSDGVRTSLAANGGCADHPAPFPLLDELHRCILVAEEYTLDVHVQQSIHEIRRRCEWGGATPCQI